MKQIMRCVNYSTNVHGQYCRKETSTYKTITFFMRLLPVVETRGTNVACVQHASHALDISSADLIILKDKFELTNPDKNAHISKMQTL